MKTTLWIMLSTLTLAPLIAGQGEDNISRFQIGSYIGATFIVEPEPIDLDGIEPLSSSPVSYRIRDWETGESATVILWNSYIQIDQKLTIWVGGNNGIATHLVYQFPAPDGPREDVPRQTIVDLSQDLETINSQLAEMFEYATSTGMHTPGFYRQAAKYLLLLPTSDFCEEASLLETGFAFSLLVPSSGELVPGPGVSPLEAIDALYLAILERSVQCPSQGGSSTQ